jgi:hypothetical protein
MQRSDPLAGADPRWLDMARKVLADQVNASTPTMDLVLAQVAAKLDAEFGAGNVPVPGPTRALEILREITKGSSAFGGARAKREIDGRPAAPYGKLRALRPGEYLLLDTNRLDVYAMDPLSLRWVQAELTIAMDLYDRGIAGLRLTPVSTKAVDVAAVLFKAVRSLPEPAAGWVSLQPPYRGMPGAVVIDAGKLAGADGEPLLPSVPAEETIIAAETGVPVEALAAAARNAGIRVRHGVNGRAHLLAALGGPGAFPADVWNVFTRPRAEQRIRRLLTLRGQPSLQHAARQLGIKTALLAGQVRQLETTVGTALLRTGPDGQLALTAYGQRFARDIRPALESPAQSRSQTTRHSP